MAHDVDSALHFRNLEVFFFSCPDFITLDLNLLLPPLLAYLRRLHLLQKYAVQESS